MTTRIKMLTKYCSTVLSLLFISTLATGQSNLFEEVKKLYPDETAVFTKYYLDVDIAIEKDELVVTSNRIEEKLLLTERTSMHAKDQIYSSSFEELSDIEAYTLTPHKNKYKKEKVEAFKETYDKNSSVFYDDTKVLNFIYPAVTQGAKTFVSYTQKHSEPRFTPSYYFQTYIPILDGRYKITVDKGVDLDFFIRNTEHIQLDSTTIDEKDRLTYIFSVKNLDKIEYETSSPNIRYFAPHLNVLIRSFKLSTGRQPLLEDEVALFNWYKTFIKDLKDHDSNNLKPIVSEITSGLSTDLEKVKAIYYWVQENIKYIAFEDGMRGLIPHNGEYVCEKRFGDCKDMASILINMMHLAGIDGYFTWIGTRDIPYNYSKTPSPIVDNHMIATYIENGQHYFLDATSQYSPFGLPSSMIQGKEALIGKGETPEIVKVPVIAKEKNIMLDSLTLQLNNGIIEGFGKTTLTGYAKVFNSYRIITKNEESVKNYLLKLLAKGSNKFILNDYTVENIENMDKPIKIQYSFNINDYYNQVGNEIYINPNLDKSFIDDIIDEDRNYPKENEYKYINHIVTKLIIPENYTASYIPENSSFKNDVFGFEINYQNTEGAILIEKKFHLDYLLLEKQDFEDWNKAIKLMSQSLRESIILTDSKS